MTAMAWYRTCGVQAEQGDRPCGQCHVPLEPPLTRSAKIGRVVTVKGQPRYQNRLALQESAASARILVKGGEVVEMMLADKRSDRILWRRS